MKNNTMNNRNTFVILNIVTAVLAACSAYGFCISNAKGNHWVLFVILLAFAADTNKILDKKAEKLSLIAGSAAALVTAALVISQAGSMVLNIRYASIVFMAGVAVLHAAMAFFALAGKAVKSAE